ncbi:NAD(P)/FAD-dependent oxidoreductase [Sphingobacterium sp. 1.A.4]|uniref:NAD(P)/FAD-dependent oxidoreductase n=1 Tax=Sphingobacterium sp. 1.A.4 TaxID=2044603 RepID=UPI000C0C04F7|nr:NAD(P)/FAD-dependent oxidoreductase [Sphingobacterium sp. 1.A.4]
MKEKTNFDVIIIGGSYAGLSAAMSLGRSLREVLIVDSGLPCNRYTPHSHNFITHDGAVPGDIAAKAKSQVLEYRTVSYHQDIALSGQKINTGYQINTRSGKTFQAKKLIFATGVRDIFPAIKGFEESWGKSLIHCPYCHGYEVKGQKTAILANGERALHVGGLVDNLTKDLTVITRGKADFSEEQWKSLERNRIRVIERDVVEVMHHNGQIKAVLFDDGTQENYDAAYAAIPFEQHCDIPVSLGCELTQAGHLKVDQFHQTTVGGIFAAGDCTSMFRSVANAVSTGNLAGAMVNHQLV